VTVYSDTCAVVVLINRTRTLASFSCVSCVRTSFQLLSFPQVANCAPSRPREDAGRVPGNPASSYVPSVFSSSVSSVGSNIIKNGHKRKTASSSTAIERLDTSLNVKDQPPNEIAAFRRVYRWSTGCSSVRPGGGLMRFLLNGVDARGNSNDPDSEFSFFFCFFLICL